IEKSIISTLAYFDIFNFPLTKQELWQNLWIEDPATVVNESLRQDFEKAFERLIPKYINCAGGFCGLASEQFSQKIVTRKENYRAAIRKKDVAAQNAKLLSRMPFVRAIFLCNNLAYDNSRDDSDIDFFVVTKRGRLFVCRFFCVLLMKILRRRPTKMKTRDKICLSFWVDECRLGLGDILKQNDIYLHYWLKQLVPLYDSQNLLNKIWQQNVWIKYRVPNVLPYRSSSRLVQNVRQGFLSRIFSAFVPHFVENIAREIQIAMLPSDVKNKMQTNDGPAIGGVIVGVNIFKAHVNDRREQFKNLWLEKVEKIYATS
ncbi:hypothetical protein HY932_01400, partial [Candidatus Falkowbacteria bacterium]|nr:hypothetical protein [Candidatus Falkowbacteria bacterium]